MPSEEIETFALTKLELNEGDALIVHFKQKPSAEVTSSVNSSLRYVLDNMGLRGVSILIEDEETATLSVMRKAS